MNFHVFRLVNEWMMNLKLVKIKTNKQTVEKLDVSFVNKTFVRF